jgi:predicted O-linked N-acetylglucosamine transferase (SPINDLY family)
MGVPVLTLAGSAPYQRGAASILPRVGLAELVTNSLEDYEQTAVALARDWGRLEALRGDLRPRMAASVLCDEKSFVADFERGLRLAWQRWCAGLLPADIDLAEQSR